MKKVKVGGQLLDEDLAKRYRYSLKISKDDPFIDMWGRIGILNRQAKRDEKKKKSREFDKAVSKAVKKELIKYGVIK